MGTQMGKLRVGERLSITCPRSGALCSVLPAPEDHTQQRFCRFPFNIAQLSLPFFFFFSIPVNIPKNTIWEAAHRSHTSILTESIKAGRVEPGLSAYMSPDLTLTHPPSTGPRDRKTPSHHNSELRQPSLGSQVRHDLPFHRQLFVCNKIQASRITKWFRVRQIQIPCSALSYCLVGIHVAQSLDLKKLSSNHMVGVVEIKITCKVHGTVPPCEYCSKHFSEIPTCPNIYNTFNCKRFSSTDDPGGGHGNPLQCQGSQGSRQRQKQVTEAAGKRHRDGRARHKAVSALLRAQTWGGPPNLRQMNKSFQTHLNISTAAPWVPALNSTLERTTYSWVTTVLAPGMVAAVSHLPSNPGARALFWTYEKDSLKRHLRETPESGWLLLPSLPLSQHTLGSRGDGASDFKFKEKKKKVVPPAHFHTSWAQDPTAAGVTVRTMGSGVSPPPALPPPRPQPYRTLKESDSAGDEAESPEQRAREPVGPTPAPHDRAASIDLLEDVFSNLDMEVPLQPLGQAKSLEDLRTPKDVREQPGTFDYQRLDLGRSDRSRGTPGALKLAHPHSRLWSLGQDDMAIPSKPPAACPKKPSALLGDSLASPCRPQNQNGLLNPSDKEEVPTPTLGSITIPRPQGRKTPELGIVPPPPTARPAKLQAPGLALGDFSEQLPAEWERRATLSSAPFPGLLSSAAPQDPTELLQPLNLAPGAAGSSSDALLALLDPLNTAWSGSSLPPGPTAPNVATPFTPQFSFPPMGTPTPFPQPSLNPFVPSVPATLPTVPLVSAPAGPFGARPASLGPAFAPTLLLSGSGFCAPHRPQPSLSALSMPNLFGQVPMGTHSPQPLGPPAVAPSRIRTLPLARSSARAAEAKQGLALRPGDPPLLPSRPPQSLEPALQPSAPREARDPFEDLLRKTKQDVSSAPAPAPAPGSVEQLRKQWETFE
ncbi:hypothetical protein FD755_008396 [Muntiacus reevesi]|uniref:DENN domain-containing protein 1A n=1 Tax=Muntiacus reevesi TaxID=9886 RepID=A0A5J5MM46_MUNRE|nr:hypothetical protein FD755_008396 [Muntiacus reevesi]